MSVGHVGAGYMDGLSCCIVLVMIFTVTQKTVPMFGSFITSGSDLHGTRNADSDGHPKRSWSWTSEDESE